MRDRELVEAFEACTLPGEQFDHRQHIRLAWLYLREPGDAFTRFREGLIRYATSLGAATKYDEHITTTLLEIIRDRMYASHAADFDAFVAKNADLLDWRRVVGGSLKV